MRLAQLVPLLALLPALTGCPTIDDLTPENRDCDTRHAYYPDQDGDGVGSDSAVYIGCAAPDGYVEVGGDCDDGDASITSCEDSGDTGHAGIPRD